MFYDCVFYLVDQKDIVFRVGFDELQQDSENRVLKLNKLTIYIMSIYFHSLENDWPFFWLRVFLKPSMFRFVKQPGRMSSIFFFFRNSSTAKQRSSIFIFPSTAGIFPSQAKTFSWTSSIFCWHRTLHRALAWRSKVTLWVFVSLHFWTI